MSIEDALYLHLSNDAEVVALASTRIYPLVIPQAATLPAIAYQVIDDVPNYTHGPQVTGEHRARVQLTLQGSYSQVVSLGLAVRKALHRFSGSGTVDVQSVQVEATRDGYTTTFERATRRVDALIWYYSREEL